MSVISNVYGVQYFPYFGGNAIWDTQNSIWDAENAIWDTENAIWDTPTRNTEHSRVLDLIFAQKMSKMRTWSMYVLRKREKQNNNLQNEGKTESGILFWWTRHNNNKQNIQFNLFLFLSLNLLSRLENECARESLKWRSKHVKTKQYKRCFEKFKVTWWRAKSLPVCFCLWRVNLFVLFLFWFWRTSRSQSEKKTRT